MDGTSVSTYITILLPPLPHTYRVLDFITKVSVDDGIDLRGAESDAGRIQDAVRSTVEEEGVCRRVDGDEVAVGPDIYGWYRG